MTKLQILAEIDQIISDDLLSRVEKCKRLTDLSRQYWQMVFPEIGTEAYSQLSDSEQEARWARVRAETEHYFRESSNSKWIHEVLDWPVTGQPFSWLFPDYSK